MKNNFSLDEANDVLRALGLLALMDGASDDAIAEALAEAAMADDLGGAL